MSDDLTWGVFVAFGLGLLAWEFVLLVAEARRTTGPRVHTISQVVMARAKKATCVPYTWGCLASHYFPFWPRTSDPYTRWGYGLAIGLAAALLVSDVLLRGREWSSFPVWVRFARWPALWLVVGLLAGVFLFAQRTAQPWESP